MTARTLADSAIVVTASDILIGEFGDELVILNLRDGVYHGLEDVGARIWTLLKQPVTLGSICDALVSEYDVERKRCERDVRALVGDLVAKGLVEIREHS